MISLSSLLGPGVSRGLGLYRNWLYFNTSYHKTCVLLGKGQGPQAPRGHLRAIGGGPSLTSAACTALNAASVPPLAPPSVSVGRDSR